MHVLKHNVLIRRIQRPRVAVVNRRNVNRPLDIAHADVLVRQRLQQPAAVQRRLQPDAVLIAVRRLARHVDVLHQHVRQPTLRIAPHGNPMPAIRRHVRDRNVRRSAARTHRNLIVAV